MKPKDRSQKVLQELAKERAAQGWGSAAGIDQRMGKSEGYLGRVLRGEVGLQIDTLFEALEVLGADPADFFGRAVGTRVRPDRLLRRLEGQDRGPVHPALERLERLMAGEEAATPPAVSDPALEIGALRDRLDKLDAARFSDPDEALQSAAAELANALRLAETTPGRQTMAVLCQALGASGSVYRVQARFGPAARCLRCALRLSRKWKLRQARADLLQRTCYLLADQGEYRVAAEVARQAIDAYVLLNDLPGIGKALVDRAIMLAHGEHRKAAIEAYRASLGYLRKDRDWSNRYAVYQGLGWLYTELDDLDQAWRWVSKATTACKIHEGQNWWRLLWLKGEIALKRDQPRVAAEVLREARDAFMQQDNPFDIAVISLRLAKALLLEGKVAEMQGIAADMMRLLKPLHQNKIASAAIHEFTCAALAGEVTVELLDRACEQIRKGCPGSRGTRISY